MKTSSYNKRGAASSHVARLVVKILSNANRYNLMKLLLYTKRDLCVHELAAAVGISQSAASHQLAYLQACGIVRSVRTGKTACYLPTNTLLCRKVASVIESLK